MVEMAGDGGLVERPAAGPETPPEEAYEGPCPACDIASVWVDKALRGSTQWVDSCSAGQMRAFRLWRRTKMVASPAKYALLLLAVVETPSWCLQPEIPCAHMRHGMRGSSIPTLSPLACNFVEMLLLLFLLARRALRITALGAAYKTTVWRLLLAGLMLASLVDCAVASVNTIGMVPTSFRISRLCRPLIFVAHSKALRQIATRIALSVPRFIDALVSLAICLALFVWVGLLLFAKTDEGSGHGQGVGSGHFATWSNGFASLWILFTTANFPDVMLPGLEEWRSSFWFFFFYLVASLYLLNNVMLAAVYDAYKDQLRDGLRTFYEQRDLAIRHAFDLLADNSGEVPARRWESFFRSHFGGRGAKFVDPRLLAYNAQRSLAIFRAMDYDQSNGLSFPQFRVIIEAILNDKIYIPVTHPPAIGRGPRAKAVRSLIIAGAEVCGGRRLQWDTAVDIVILVDVVILLAQTVVYVSPLGGGSFAPDPLRPHQAWSYVLFTFSCLYAMETSTRIAILGFERYWHKRPFQYRFDFVTVYVLFLTEVLQLFGLLPLWSLQLVVLLRLTRGLRILRHVKRLECVVQLMTQLMPIYRNLGLMLFMIFYSYATIGVQIFGGLIYEDNKALDGSDYQKQGYWVLNFNDVNSGMMTLFVLMVVNNWYIIADAFLRTSGTRWAAAFFVSFFVVVNLVVLNILVTLIIECFAGNVHCETDGGGHARSIDSLNTAADGSLLPSLRPMSPSRPRETLRASMPVGAEESLLRRLLLVENEDSHAMSFVAPLNASARQVPMQS